MIRVSQIKPGTAPPSSRRADHRILSLPSTPSAESFFHYLVPSLSPLSDSIYLSHLVSVSRPLPFSPRLSPQQVPATLPPAQAALRVLIIRSTSTYSPPRAHGASAGALHLVGAPHRGAPPPSSPTPESPDPAALPQLAAIPGRNSTLGRACDEDTKDDCVWKKLLSLQVPGRAHAKPGRQFYGQKRLYFWIICILCICRTFWHILHIFHIIAYHTLKWQGLWFAGHSADTLFT